MTNYVIPKEAYWYMIPTSSQILMHVANISQSVKNIITLAYISKKKFNLKPISTLGQYAYAKLVLS
jgi:hypothetical protein